MQSFLAITSALADESRIRILAALDRGELCVCQITELLELAPSTVSKHLLLLKQARLVESRKEGRWIYYRRADSGAPPPVLAAIHWVRESLARDSRIAADVKRLKGILKTDPKLLCCAQREGVRRRQDSGRCRVAKSREVKFLE